MQKNSSRRRFIRHLSLLTTGAALLPKAQAASGLWGAKVPFPGYNPYMETKNDLRPIPLGTAELQLSGTVFDKQLKPIPHCIIEVWHLSPGSNSYKHRGRISCDARGRYSLITDFPGREKGKLGRIYFKAFSEGIDSFSQLMLSNEDAHVDGHHWERNQALGENLFPNRQGNSIEFNFIS